MNGRIKRKQKKVKARKKYIYIAEKDQEEKGIIKNGRKRGDIRS